MRQRATSLDVDELQELCTSIANSMPVTIEYAHGGSETRAWGCSIDNDGYCDDCPVQKICPYTNKNYSK